MADGVPLFHRLLDEKEEVDAAAAAVAVDVYPRAPPPSPVLPRLVLRRDVVILSPTEASPGMCALRSPRSPPHPQNQGTRSSSLRLRDTEMTCLSLRTMPLHEDDDASKHAVVACRPLGLTNIDPEIERDPPNAPTPITFPEPTFSANATSAWTAASPPPKLQPLFAKIQRPTDVTSAHLAALNIQAGPPCSPEELLPRAPDDSSYLPPLTPDQPVSAVSYAEVTQAVNESGKRREQFGLRLVELQIDNDAGFRAITRSSLPGSRPPRLGYMRKFWEGLESVAHYWDTSLDQYYEGLPPHVDQEGDKGAKRQRLDSFQWGQKSIAELRADSSISDDMDTQSRGPPGQTNSSISKGSETQPGEGPGPAEPATAAASLSLPADMNASQSEALVDEREHIASSNNATSEPSRCQRYKGRRTASGRDMPDLFRSDTVKGFVEGAVWSFGCKVAPPRTLPILQMNKLRIPIRQTAVVYRLPTDCRKGRQGYLEGPVLSVQCRPEIEFHKSMTESDKELGDGIHAMQDTKAGIQAAQGGKTGIEASKDIKTQMDALREIGGLIQLAQERRRQGRTEVRSGQGKWWTTTTRWGGADDGIVIDEVAGMTEEIAAPRSARRTKKKHPLILWRELKPGSKQWDPKVDYKSIGKDPRANYDEVFMVSSLNHHISILKLTVHDAYLEYVETEKMPSPPPRDADWSMPRLQRTRWYDLLDRDQRVEAFRTLWGIMAFLTRHTGDSAATEGGDIDRSTK